MIDLKKHIKQKLSKYRSLLRFVERDDFKHVWDRATIKEQQELVTILEGNCTREAIRNWFDKILEAECLNVATIKRLRVVASQMGIPRYYHMTKTELLTVIGGRLRDKNRNVTSDYKIL